MFGNSIASRVSRVIKARVKAAQRQHDEFCRKADDECEKAKKAAEASRDSQKEAKALELVDSIIGKSTQ